MKPIKGISKGLPISELTFMSAAFSQIHITRQLYEATAQKLGWKPSQAYKSIVEREILVFDTFYLLNTTIGESLTFGGGTLLNWVYLRDAPRFSFDIDSTYVNGPTSKDWLLGNLIGKLNRSLRSRGYAREYEFGERSIELGSVQLDVEKDHFQNLLSLKRSMPCYETGSELAQFLKRSNLSLTPNEARTLRKLWGALPRIEEVRIEIAFQTKAEESARFPHIRRKVIPLVGDALQVQSTVGRVTKPETIAALKILDLAKTYAEEELPNLVVDFIKDVCDLRMLQELDGDSVVNEIQRLSNADVNPVLRAAVRQVEKIAADGRAANWYAKRGTQTIFLRRQVSFQQLTGRVKQLIEDLMVLSP